MFTLIWIPAAIAASALQVARNAAQRGLMPRSGPWAATLVRFMFGLPFALAITGVVALLTPDARPHMGPVFWGAAMTGAASQVLATACLLVAMRGAGFAVATALQQCAMPLTAVIGLVVFKDQLTPGAWAGVMVTTAGLAALTWPSRLKADLEHAPQPLRGTVYGVLSGLLFGYSLNAFRHATLAFDPAHPLLAAVSTVATAQAVQTLVLAALLLLLDPFALRQVFAAWRQSLSAGLFGTLASACWLLALALAPAAQVRAMGVMEAPMAALAGRRLFKERLRPKQILAGAVVLAGVLMTTLA